MPPASFDMVFSKDSIVHIPDKHALTAEVFSVLKPGGGFIAPDWLIGQDGVPSPEMADYIQSEGMELGMASPARYRDAMTMSGFTEVSSLHGPVGMAADKNCRAGFRRSQHRNLDADDPCTGHGRALPDTSSGAQTRLTGLRQVRRSISGKMPAPDLIRGGNQFFLKCDTAKGETGSGDSASA